MSIGQQRYHQTLRAKQERLEQHRQFQALREENKRTLPELKASIRDTAAPQGKRWTKGQRKRVKGLSTEQQIHLQARRVEQELT